MDENGASLELRSDDGKPRYYLVGQPLDPGTTLELWQGGRWHPGRYDWGALDGTLPVFLSEEKIVWLSPASLLRWPQG